MSYLKYVNQEPLNVARGLVRDAEIVNIFGVNALMSTTYIPAWENATAYTFPTANTTMGIKSTVGGDTSTILIKGLDSNYVEKNVTVTLAGTANTLVSTPLFRINDMITLSGGTPTGTVTLTGGSTIYGQINPNIGKSQRSMFTVPAGHKYYLNRIDAFCASAAINNRELAFRNRVRLSNGVVYNVAESPFLEQLHVNRHYPFTYDEKTDISFELKASAGTQKIGVFGEGILIDETGIGLRS